MPEITDAQRAAEAAACPYCRRKAEGQANARLAWENDQLRAELRAAVDALRDMLEDGGMGSIDNALGIVAAYDAKHPEAK